MSNATKARKPKTRDAGIAEDGTFEPITISTKGAAPDEDRVPLFTIDDVEYTIPRAVRPNLAIRYLRDVKQRGADYAVAAAMETLLGEDAMNALADCEHVGEQEMDRLMSIVEAKLMGAVESVQGK